MSSTLNQGPEAIKHRMPRGRKFCIPGISSWMAKVDVKKALNHSRSLLIIRRHSDLEFLVCRSSVEIPTSIVAWGELVPTLEDVVVLTMLPIYGEKNAIGVTLVKLEYQNFALTSSKSYGKAYASWIRFLDEGEVSQSRLEVEALLSYCL